MFYTFPDVNSRSHSVANLAHSFKEITINLTHSFKEITILLSRLIAGMLNISDKLVHTNMHTHIYIFVFTIFTPMFH